jgi:hypothetical protein
LCIKRLRSPYQGKKKDVNGGRKGREAKMYIVEFIFFGDSRLFREILTSVDEVEQFLRGFDELEQKLIYINIIRKITS